jgi:hypothetical protein
MIAAEAFAGRSHAQANVNSVDGAADRALDGAVARGHDGWQRMASPR